MRWEAGSHVTRSFVAMSSIALLLFAFAVRLRLHAAITLPSSEPGLWFIGGFVEDVIVVGTAAAIALSLLKRIKHQAAIRVGFGIFVALFSLIDLGVSEAVIFLGAPLRPEDFRGGIPAAVLANSLTTLATLLLVGALAALVITINITSRIVASHRFDFLTGRVCIAIAIVALLATPLMSHVHRIAVGRDGVVALVRVGHEEAKSAVAGKVAFPQPTMSITMVRELITASPHRQFMSPDYPLAYVGEEPPPTAPRVPPGVKPNVVILIVESLRAEEVGCYKADPPGVTPNIDRIAAEGIRVDPAYSAGTFTASGELAVQYGLIPVAKEILLSSRPGLPFVGLPELLRAAGWRDLLWIHNGDVNFYRRDLFYAWRGVKMIDGRDFPTNAPKTSWGYSDRSLAPIAVNVLSRAREPFFSTVITVSNHHPYDLPEDAGQPIPLPQEVNRSMNFGAKTKPMIQTVHYCDQAIGDFFAQASKKPWFAHTIFVIVGDHGTTVPPLQTRIQTRHQMVDLLHRVAMIFYSPMFKGGYAVQGPASQADIVPTILDMANVKFPRTGMGVNIFGPEMAQRWIVMWAAHIRTLTILNRDRVYHARYPGDDLLIKQSPIESFFDAKRDPLGTNDLIDGNDPWLPQFRRLSKIYREVYQWTVVSGHAGLPPNTLPRRGPLATTSR